MSNNKIRRKNLGQREAGLAKKVVNKKALALNSPEFILSHRTNENAFTRNRQLPFSVLVCVLLNQLKGAVRRECADFFEEVLDQPLSAILTAAAFSDGSVLNLPNKQHLHDHFQWPR